MERLDVYLSKSLNLSRNSVVKIIDADLVKVNNVIEKPSYKLKKDDVVEYDFDKINEFLKEKPLEPYEFELDIKYEDDDILVINKPKQMLTHPTKFERNKTLCNALIYHTKGNLSDIGGLDRLGIVHRLDKNTSGLMIACKNNLAHTNIANQIKTKQLKRKYLALAIGNFKEKEGRIEKKLVHYLKDDVKMKVTDDEKGLNAITDYKVVEEFKDMTLVELSLQTGRTHQIRAHLASLHHPLFGDNLYGAKGFIKNEYKKLKTVEQLLQSYYISFNHPKTGKKMEFQLNENEYSEDFIKVLNFLRSNK